MTAYPTPMIDELARAAVKRYHSAKLEGLNDHAAFEEIIRTILQVVEEFNNARS